MRKSLNPTYYVILVVLIRKIKIKDYITLANCICGILAIFFSIMGLFTSWTTPWGIWLPLVYPVFHIFFFDVLVCITPWGFWMAAIFMFSAMFLDIFDGFIARKLEQSDKFGVQFDSTSDLVSFGIAPAIFTFNYYGIYLNLWPLGDPRFGLQMGLVLISIIIFLTCSLTRLAWFNSKVQVEAQGIPTTIPAVLVVVLYWNHIFTAYNTLPGSEVAFIYIGLRYFFMFFNLPAVICIFLIFIGFCNFTGYVRLGTRHRNRSAILYVILLMIFGGGGIVALIGVSFHFYLTHFIGMAVQLKTFAMIVNFSTIFFVVAIFTYIGIGFKEYYLWKKRVKSAIKQEFRVESEFQAN